MDNVVNEQTDSALQIYLQLYTALCEKSRVRTVESLKNSIQQAIKETRNMEQFKLNGNSAELKFARIDDLKLETIMAPLFSTAGEKRIQLRKLDLSYNEIRNKGSALIAKLVKEESFLGSLDLKFNAIGDEGGADIASALAYSSSIVDVDLSGNPIGELGGMALASSLQINCSLDSLRIAGCDLTASAMIAICNALQSNVHLQLLDIGNNFTSRLTQTVFTNVMQQFGNALCTNKTLREISLAKSGITDWVICDFFADNLARNNSLVVLDLSSNKIGKDGGIAFFKAIETHATLLKINLSCCSIQDEGAAQAAQYIISNLKIKTLHLDYNSITGAGIVLIADAIKQNNSLEYISLWGNKWDSNSCAVFAPLVLENKEDSNHKEARLLKSGCDLQFTEFDGILTVAHLQ